MGVGLAGEEGRSRLSEEQREAVAELRAVSHRTRRATVQDLEDVLYEVLPVLDRGFVRVVDYMGDDGAIVQAARVSYGRGTRTLRSDSGLISYLMRHRHTSPFEMCEIKLHVKLPLFVARQWIRHRTANVNEYSGRYSILDNEFYLPEQSVLASQASASRQGRERRLSSKEAAHVLRLLREDSARAYGHYREMLNQDESGEPLDSERDGLARELARINLPLSLYTQWYWKIDLHNLFHFVLLRSAEGAQYEIREYSRAIEEILRRWVPVAYQAFDSYWLRGAQLSSGALEVVRRFLKGDNVAREDTSLSKREWNDLMKLLEHD
jgi:thymidylate synthase (FAD)